MHVRASPARTAGCCEFHTRQRRTNSARSRERGAGEVKRSRVGIKPSGLQDLADDDGLPGTISVRTALLWDRPNTSNEASAAVSYPQSAGFVDRTAEGPASRLQAWSISRDERVQTILPVCGTPRANVGGRRRPVLIFLSV